jgi:hypothetical protein
VLQARSMVAAALPERVCTKVCLHSLLLTSFSPEAWVREAGS